MAREHKRKRSADEGNDVDQPAAKVQISGDSKQQTSKPKPEKKTGKDRQKKSERGKKNKVHAKHERSSKSAKPAPAIESVPSGGLVSDDLATGQDFVSLGGTSKPVHKAKRQGPRGARLAAKRQKELEAAASGDQKAASKSTSSKTADAPASTKTTSKTADGPASARFICFVGNLPYTVTTEQIAAHFSKLKPKSIRLSTDKKTGKCKGFAFLEFEDYDKMKTCLKLYHHSIFDPDQTEGTTGGAPNLNGDATSKGRKINVELTAGGGGGKSEGRREKIVAKNKKLNEERARDWEKKKEEENGKPAGSRPQRERQVKSGANTEDVNPFSNVNRGDIHPSRMNRVMG